MQPPLSPRPLSPSQTAQTPQTSISVPASTPSLSEAALANIVLAPGLPAHLKQLLRDYFTANNTNQVPSEIYCLQTHRVFRTIKDASGNSRQAVYISHKTACHLDIETFSLRSMRGAKSSECLLVASGKELSQPVILARQKPYSNEFRAWRGSMDNGSGPMIATRCLLDDAKEADLTQKRDIRSQSNFLRHQGIATDDSTLEADRKSKEVANTTQGRHMPASVKRQKLSMPPSADSNQQSHVQGECQSTPRQAVAPTDSPLEPPDPNQEYFVRSAAPPIRVTIRFLNDDNNEVRSSRDLVDCNTREQIFGNARAGGLLSARDFAVLKATVVGTAQDLALVDDYDFRELMAMIDCHVALRAEEVTVVEIRKYG